MGKNLKYGEFTFATPPARPTATSVSTARSTKGIPKAMYDAPHAMKKGGMCSPKAGYAKGGPKRESEATVRKEVALLSKAGAPKALVQHEVREIKGEKDTPATKKAEIGVMRKAKAPLAMIKEEMMEPTGMKKGGAAKMDMKMGKVMKEYGDRELHSGSKTGPIVRNPKQAIAIAYSEGRKAKKMNEGGQYAAEAPGKMKAEGEALGKLAKKYGVETQKYAKGGSVESKLEKHADMPASKAHGPGAGAKLAKGGVPTFSKVPKFGRMK